MKDVFHLRAADPTQLTRELTATLRSSLDRKYSEVLAKAQGQWEQRFAGKDPSDACVSVRVAPRSAGTRGNPSWKAA